MCNYWTDKLNTPQSKAFPDPWLPDVDKEQAAFFGQLTLFKIVMPELMQSVAWMWDFCLSLKAEYCRYTVKHASVIQWCHQCVLQNQSGLICLGFGQMPIGAEGDNVSQPMSRASHIATLSLFCSTLTFHREIRRLAFLLYPREQESPTNWHWYNLQVMAACLHARGCLRI